MKKEKQKKPPNPTLVKMFPTIYRNSVSAETLQLNKDKPKLPGVNILPETALGELRKQKMKRAMGIAVITTLGLVGGVWAYQQYEMSDLLNELEAIGGTQSLELQNQGTLTAVEQYYTQLQNRIDTAVEIYSNQTAYAEILQGIYAAAPQGVQITSINIEMAPSEGGENGEVYTCGVSTEPFAPEPEQALGCVFFEGFVAGRDNLNTFTQGLDNVPNIKSPYISQQGSASPGSQTVPFSGTATIPLTASFSENAGQLFESAQIPGINLPGVPEENIIVEEDPIIVEELDTEGQE